MKVLSILLTKGHKMSVFEYDDYKMFVWDWVTAQKNGGYGVFTRIANYLDTTSVVMSQTFRGSRELSLEQATSLAEYLRLSTTETDYFLLLVQLARAGSNGLKKILRRQLDEFRLKAQAVKNRIEHSQLTDQDKAIFYSSWHYVAIWLAAPIASLSSIDRIANHLNLPEEVVSDAIRFLLDRGLLEKKGTRLDFGKNIIHVPHDSPYVVKHHANWRLKALQSMDRRKDDCLHYTGPVSLSETETKKIHEDLIQLIQKYTKRVAASNSEKLMCLNIDWFDY